MNKDLWILTEERPKKEVLKRIIERFCVDKKFSLDFEKLIIKPLIKDRKFTFTYELLGVNSNGIKRIFIKNVSGNGSFVDFLIFYQDEEPKIKDTPLYAIEETKTDDSESRNTGVYQRCSKFVYVDLYYPNCKKIMLYNLKVIQKEKPTQTNIFGTRMLLSLGVEILGKKLDPKIFKKFDSIEELIKFKDNMRGAPKGNVPILITQDKNTINVSGRLWKAGGLSHDPNIGALSIISRTLRELGWKGEIIITKHGLSQGHLNKGNKFIKIANEIGIKIAGLTLPSSKLHEEYWHYEFNSEKLGTIFLHLILEELENVKGIYENHAGCERGYFYTKEKKPIALHKYIEDTKSKGKIPKIPDLIICDGINKEILNLEGKTYNKKEEGIEDVKRFDIVEKEYIKIYYPSYKIVRGVVLFGSKENKIRNKEIIFLLNANGEMITSENTPQIILNALEFVFNLNKK